ncbi:MAG TPA: sialidase family protein [Candidatus Hydrogenedens sp.]|nr:sialidase family protein [Candidatus Hydrogenedens sp.]
MRRFITLSICLCLFFAIVLLIAYVYGENTSLKEGKDYLVICRDGGVGAYEAFPDICRIPDGRLLCVFYDGYTHVSLPNEEHPKGGRISGIFSSDEGKTWGEPFVIYDSFYDDRDPSITVIDGKKLICNFFSLKPAENQNERWEGLGTWIICSEDWGKTWSESKQIFPEYYCSSPIRTLPDGTLIMSLYGREQGNGAVSFSNDKGLTWSKPIDVPIGDLKLDSEPDVCVLKNQNLFMAQRGRSSEPMGFSLSADGGRTWSISKPLNFPGHCPYLHRAPSGVLLMGIRYPKNGTYMSVSTDEAATWCEPLLVDPCRGAYPSMVTLKDNSILVVYYEEGNGSNLRARKFTVTPEGKVEWVLWTNE